METVHKEQYQPSKNEEFLILYERDTRAAKHDCCIRYTKYTFHCKQMNSGFCEISAHSSDNPAIASVSFIYNNGVGVPLEVSS